MSSHNKTSKTNVVSLTRQVPPHSSPKNRGKATSGRSSTGPFALIRASMQRPDEDYKDRPTDEEHADIDLYRAVRVVRLKDKLQSLYESHIGGEQPFQRYYADLHDDPEQAASRVPNHKGRLDVKAWLSGLRNAYNLIWRSEMAEISGRHLEADDLLGDAKYWMGVTAGLGDQAALFVSHPNDLQRESLTSATMRDIGSKGGTTKNQPYKLPRLYCRERWEAEKHEYDNNKSEFARSYVKLIAQKFSAKDGTPLHVKESTVKEWLK